MRKIGTLLIALSFSLAGFTQVGMGQWRMHISPNSAIDVVEGNGAVYTILKNGMLEYDLKEGEKTVWTVANYLSDVSPSALAYDKGSANLLIGYENGNIDFINKGTVSNLPAIVQSSINGLKKINRIIVKDGLAYLATGVGIVVVDLNKKEIRDTYNPTTSGTKFIDIAFFQGNIYVLTEAEVYVGNENNSFLADPGQWTKISTIPDYTNSGVYTDLEAFDDKLFLAYNHEFYNGDTIYRIESGSPTVFLDEVEINGLDRSNDNLLVSIAGSVFNYDVSLTQIDNIFQYSNMGFPDPQHACIVGDDYFIADGNWGMIKARTAYQSNGISFTGPRYNSSFRVKWRNGTLAVANGGFSGTSPSFSRKGGSFMQDEKWTSTVINKQEMLQGTDSWDFISTAINPKNTKEIAYGSYSAIPLVIANDGVVTDTLVFSNSLIEETGNVGWGYISDIEYDSKGNLWVANANAIRPLKVKSESGIWYDFNVGSAVNSKITGRLIIDNNNTKWISVLGTGLLAFNEGENIDDASDDKYRLLTTTANNGGLPSSSVEALAEDFDGNIWIGTPEGMRVLYNATNIFDAAPGQYDFQKLLIEFGENVEIVLGTTHITSIEIDGANRKWIGTASSGVFLLSPDGLSVERNFTAENSSLLSNSILDIAINQTNGEVFIVTENGLISYRSDASQGDLDYTNVNVFPNPVHPDYFGPITIQGIAYNSDVKITDISGKLVYKTISNGGTATWSGNTLDGERAATGVYLIWTSVDDPDVKGRQVGKVVLIN